MTATLVLLLAYFAGSLPSGFMVARLVMGDDIRRHGSGNIGATNVTRVLGNRWGIVVLALDCLKGTLATLVLPRLVLPQDGPSFGHLSVGCGMAAIVGHMFPAWLKFRGGKGVATALGVVLVLNWQPMLPALLVFAGTIGLTRYVSLGSVLAALAFCVGHFVFTGHEALSGPLMSLTAFSTLIPLLIIGRHRTNIGRLLRGEESRFGVRQ